MIKEREGQRIQGEAYRVGRKTVFLARIEGGKALLLVPEGVEVRVIDDPEEVKPARQGIYTIEPGKFLAKNLKTGEEEKIEFSPNSNCLEKAV